MCEVILADLAHPYCSLNSRCLEERARKLLSALSLGASEPVYMLLQQHACSVHELDESAFVQKCAALKTRLKFFSDKNLVALLYRIKQAVDERGLSCIRVMTCKSRLAELQVCQKRLFTQTYRFTYSTVLECSACPATQLTSTSSSQLALLEEQISSFLQHLPALRGDITILKSPLISDCFVHGFTTRTGGISYNSTLSSLNLFSSSRRRDSSAEVTENLRRLSIHAGFHPSQFHRAKVNHANDVWVMNKPEPESYDAIVTNQAGVIIAAPGADCMPLLFADPEKKVIGVAHSGWKGTLMGVAMATVNAMMQEFGSELASVVAVIGPSVGPCCFTLEQDSARKFQAIHPDCVRNPGSTAPYVDIRLATRILLERGGILPEHIQDNTVTDSPNVTLCTSCHPDLFFSHVRDGINFGTQIGFLGIKESHPHKQSDHSNVICTKQFE